MAEDEELNQYGLVSASHNMNKPIALRVECVYIPVIGQMDITTNTYQIKVDLDISWEATEEDIQKLQRDPSGYSPSFVPNLVFPSSKEVEFDDIIPRDATTSYQIQPGNRIYIRHRFIGTLTNQYVVDHFPFDVQNLVLSVGLSFYSRDQVYFEIPSDKPFVYVPLQYTKLPGFDLVRVVSGEISPDGFSNLITIIQAKRHQGPFFFRIFLPLLSINATTFSVYSVDEIDSKIGVLITAMLTFVGMIYILSTLVPMAGKGTLFDKYAMASIVLCGLGLFGNIYMEKDLVFWIHLGLVILLHFLFTIMSSDSIEHGRMSLRQNFKELVEDFNQIDSLTYPLTPPIPPPKKVKGGAVWSTM